MLEDELMTTEQVIAALSISRGTFYSRLKKGLIPKPIDFGPHRKVWDRVKIMEFIKGKENV